MKRFSIRMVRFACVGSIGTAIQYGVLALGVAVFAAPAAKASTLGYLLGSVANYWLNHRFTFRSRAAHHVAAAKYYILLAAGCMLNYFLLLLLVERLGVNLWVGQVFSTSIGFVWNFLGSHFWVFRDPAAPGRIQVT